MRAEISKSTANRTPAEGREHYCTMFDAAFLPMGLALYESLCRVAIDAELWVLALDEATLRVLQALRLPRLRTIPLNNVETADLRAVKKQRSASEYYWTLTPFVFDAVFDRAPAASRVTYLDADLYFFRSPAIILGEMDPARHVLITDHAFAPKYAHYAERSGRFCVQFVTVARTSEARSVLAWWRARCLEWCYDRWEDGRFGDQRYLESWPTMLGEGLSIVHRPDWTGAPWNACLAEERAERRWVPVFYHFHGFRCLTGDRAFLFPQNYEIGPKAGLLYREYIAAVRRSNRLARGAGLKVPGAPTPAGFEDFDPWPTVARRFLRLVRRRLQPPVAKPIVSIR